MTSTELFSPELYFLSRLGRLELHDYGPCPNGGMGCDATLAT